MYKVKFKRQSFSSPAQLQKMAMMVVNRWQEVWPEAFSRQQSTQQQSQPRQKALPKTSQS